MAMLANNHMDSLFFHLSSYLLRTLPKQTFIQNGWLEFIVKTSFSQMASKFQAKQQVQKQGGSLKVNGQEKSGGVQAQAHLRTNLVKGWHLFFFEAIQVFGLNGVLQVCERIQKGGAFQILHSELHFVKGFRKRLGGQRKILIKGLMDVLLDVNVIKLMG